MRNTILTIMAIVILVGGFTMVNAQLQESPKGEIRDKPTERLNKDYGPSYEKICNGRTCRMTLHSGVRYVLEDKQWTPVEKARSLREEKAFFPSFLEVEKGFKVEVLDYNYTSITVNLDHNPWIYSDVPVRIYKKNYSAELKDFKKEYEKEVEYNERFSLFHIAGKTRTYNFEIGDVFSFGFNSTIVILNTSNNGILEDTYVSDAAPNTDYGGATQLIIKNDSTTNRENWAVKANISILPSDADITSAQLSYYIGINNYDVNSEGINITSHELYPYPVFNISGDMWNENDLTWNTRPLGTANEFNTTWTDLTNIFGGAGEPQSEYMNWSVGPIVQSAVDKSKENVSFYMVSSYKFGSPSSIDNIRYNSKENSNVNQRPLLWIEYTTPTPAAACQTNQTGDWTVPCNCTFNDVSTIDGDLIFTGAANENMTDLNTTIIFNSTNQRVEIPRFCQVHVAEGGGFSNV